MFGLLGSAISFLADVTGLHNWYSGLKTARDLETTVNYLRRIDMGVDKIADGIVHVKKLQAVRPVTKTVTPAKLSKQELIDLLSPVRTNIKQDILVGAIFETPKDLRSLIASDPWKVFIDIRPLSRASRPLNPDLLPVLFTEGKTQYIGWQTAGALPAILGIRYTPEVLLQLTPPPSHSLSDGSFAFGYQGLPIVYESNCAGCRRKFDMPIEEYNKGYLPLCPQCRPDRKF